MSLPSTFQVCKYSFFGKGANDVDIKVTATAIDPVNHKMRDHDAFIREYPVILGSDAAGIMVAIDPDVNKLQVILQDAAELVSKNLAKTSDEEALGIMLATKIVVTAFYADGHGTTPPWEEGRQHVGRGKSVIITGGASSIEQYAIQLAHLSGYKRIFTNASSNNHDFLRKIGAHLVLDRSASTPAALFKAKDEAPLNFVFNAISAPSIQKLSIQILQKAKVPGGFAAIEGALALNESGLSGRKVGVGPGDTQPI
ncbi:hypothetical protein G6011_11818 [Alternaria panax]|uniref:Alcohol dehydrogenase-like N-terminal domain-containing protein n=1 Tax=Alternaria panax TaxID=48097 RepID=A0AAD4F7W4_9PLEO|nr:hypothetical protein G6011_11818 [Alternaria panax]